MALLIANLGPTACGLFNFFEGHITKPTESQNVYNLEQTARCATDALWANPPCFELHQESLAFFCQGR